MNLTPWKHQQELIDLNPSRYGLWHETGAGKTLSLIELANKKDCPALIIVPKSLVDQWYDSLPDLPENSIIISKENFKKNATTLPHFNTIIIDEAHYFSNFKSQMTKALLLYLKRHAPEHIYLATATPYLSSPFNVYTYFLIFGYKENWLTWQNKFYFKMKMGRRTIPKLRKHINNVPLATVMKTYLERIGGFVRMEDCFDIPEQLFQRETFSLTKEQKDAIENLDDITPIVRWTKIHQICGGTLKRDYEDDLILKSEKLQRALDLAKEHKKIAFVCRYNNEVELLKQLIEKTGKEVLTITGQTKNKHKLVSSVEGKEDVAVIINASCSEGYELPSIPIMVFYSYDFSLKNYTQMKGRILRANRLKKNVYLSLVVKGTIDEDVYKTVAVDKSDFQIELYNKHRA